MNLPVLSDKPTRAHILRLQQEMAKMPQCELHTEHFFAKGMYGRLIFSPAGTLIVGKEHKTEHFYIVLSGKVRVTTEDGVEDITGPRVLTCKPGTKRAVYVLEDAWRMNVHLNDDDTQDLQQLEDKLIQDEGIPSLFDCANKLKQELLA